MNEENKNQMGMNEGNQSNFSGGNTTNFVTPSSNVSSTNTQTEQQASVSSNAGNHDFSGVIDPNSIAVGPEAIHPQIPVDNNKNNIQSVDSINNNASEKKNNNFSLLLVAILFIGVGAFIWFMPEIRQMMNQKKKNQDQSLVEKTPETPNQSQTDNFDSMICSQVANTYTLYSEDDKLQKYTVSIEYTKDIADHYQSCLTLQQSEVNGFIVGCDKTANTVTMVRTYDFTTLPDSFIGDHMEFKKEDRVSTIKNQLEKRGYTCSQ